MMQLGSLYPCKFKTFVECVVSRKKKEMKANNGGDNSMIF